MNKKGFTIVEILAVITILAVLMMIALPAVTNLYNKHKINTWNNTVLLIEEATKEYVRDYRSQITGLDTEGDSVYIPLQKIVDASLVGWPLTDTRDSSKVNINTEVKVTIKDGEYVYDYQEEVK